MMPVLLDLVRVLALALIGAGIFLALGATATLVYAGCALLVVAAVADVRGRGRGGA